MFKHIIRPLKKLKNIRIYMSQVEFIDKINNFTRNNLKYIDSFELKITNPKNLNMFDLTIYKGTIWLSKDKMKIYKTFDNNNIEEMFDEISSFISKEIKV